MIIKNGVLILFNNTLKTIEFLYENGMEIEEIFVNEIIKKYQINIHKITAIKFNPSFYNVSSKLILTLPLIRKKYY
ncbi:hypothetical protein [Metabacillus niabensis]|uniref:hypothetical protein n=1 Tax=Metabacillus niabensis TaxID=324854 RepID=UPI0039A17F3E